MTIRQKLTQFVNFQRTVRELNQLDKRQLTDIGLTRDGIAAFARANALR